MPERFEWILKKPLVKSSTEVMNGEVKGLTPDVVAKLNEVISGIQQTGPSTIYILRCNGNGNPE